VGEFVLVASGAVMALCAVLCALCFQFARESRQTMRDVEETGAKHLESLKLAAESMADAHNTLVKVQAEQGATLDRLSADVAGKSLRR